MTTRLVFASCKGGEGRTTLVYHMAYLAAKKGFKVLVVDFDSQGNLSTLIAGRTTIKNLNEKQTISADLYKDQGIKIKPLTCQKNIHLIPSLINDTNLSARNIYSQNNTRPRQQLDKIAHEYDLILIDSPSQIGNIMAASIIASDNIIIPIKPSAYSLNALLRIKELVGHIRKAGHYKLAVTGIVLNMVNSRTNSHKESVSQIRKKIGEAVLNTSIHYRTPFEEAVERNTPVWRLRSGAALQAAKEMKNFINESFGRLDLLR